MSDILVDIEDNRTYGWWLFQIGSSQHIVPCNDLLSHEEEDCPCLPITKTITSDDGDFLCFQIVHEAWDGRE